MKKDDPKKTDDKQEEPPRIVESEKADRGDRPNTCRDCAGSKWC